MSPTGQRLHWNAGAVAPAKDSGRGWAVVAAAFVGLLLSVGVLVVYSFGVLISAMSAEFGWGSVERSTLFAAFSLSATVGGVLWGMVADRRGGRFTVLLSSVLLAVSFLALSVMPGNPVAMHLLFALIGLLGSGTLPPTFASVVVGWFDRHRGLALGISMTGVGAGAALLPPIAAALTTGFGWRNTYLVFAVAILLLMMPIAVILLRQHPDAPAQRSDAPVLRREALRAAAREGRSWILGLFALFTGAILVTSVATFVPILESRGETVMEAARYQSVLGLSLIAGRILIGVLIDRVFAPYVMMAVLLATAAGFLVLHEASSPLAYIIAAAGIGLSVGAEVDFLGFMVSRYFPPAAFATIFAVMFSTYALGASLSPLFFGWFVQASGGYGPGIMIFAGTTLLLALSMLALPRYATAETSGTAGLAGEAELAP